MTTDTDKAVNSSDPKWWAEATDAVMALSVAVADYNFAAHRALQELRSLAAAAESAAANCMKLGLRLATEPDGCRYVNPTEANHVLWATRHRSGFDTPPHISEMEMPVVDHRVLLWGRPGLRDDYDE